MLRLVPIVRTYAHRYISTSTDSNHFKLCILHLAPKMSNICKGHQKIQSISMVGKIRVNISFPSYSYPHRLFHLMPCTSSSLSYMHHNPSISDLSFYSCKPGYMLLLELFDNSHDEINQNSITTSNSHPPFNLLHNLTPSSLHVKLPLNIPIIPSVSNFYPNLSYPIYIPLEAHQPVKRKGCR